MKGLKNNTLSGIHAWISQSISIVYDSREASSIARIVLEHLFGFSATDLIMKKDNRLNESQIVQVYRVIRQLLDHVPVQHITGKAYFRDLVLEVNQHVLIPRPETEELVQLIIDLKSDDLRIWDIATGSGAIAISLGQELTHARVTASDISEDALAVAARNAQSAGINIEFLRHDILNDEVPEYRFDVVVSNPPYICHREMELMKQNVLDHEPHLALFVPDDDPLLFYRAIAQNGRKALVAGGFIFAEINEAFGPQTAQLYKDSGYTEVEIIKDLFGKDRFLKARSL
jgi:release factor glutamine methyltransferase